MGKRDHAGQYFAFNVTVRVVVSFVNVTQSKITREETLSEGFSIRLALGQVGGGWEDCLHCFSIHGKTQAERGQHHFVLWSTQ